MRRIEGFRLSHEQAIAAVEKWSRVRHPGLVGVREAFTTRNFGDQCKALPPVPNQVLSLTRNRTDANDCFDFF